MKNLIPALLFLSVITFGCTLNAQVVPSIEWEKCFGGTSNDGATSIQQISDGGYIVAGNATSPSYGGIDYLTIRLDSLGNTVWERYWGGSLIDKATSIKEISDGGFIVAGYSHSNNFNVTGNHGGDDFWIVKLNSPGYILWQKSLGGSSTDIACSVQETTDGGFMVAGYSTSNDYDVSGNHGGYDFWIVKLNSTGNLVWQKSLGGSADDEASSILQSSDGGYIVTGWTKSNNGDVSGNHGLKDFWIVKLDIDGNLVWQKSLGGSGYDYANSIEQTTDGGYIVAGFTGSNDYDVSGNHGDGDEWVIKLDASGNLLWQKCLGGNDIDQAQSVQQTTDGGYIVGGYSSSNNGDVSGNHNVSNVPDYWLVKLGTSGNILWQECLGGTNWDNAYSVQQTDDGGFIVAGAASSNDSDVSENHGSYDFWIVKLSSGTTGIASPSNSFISLYPNPVTNQLIINLAIPTNAVTIRVYDVQGRIITLPITFTNRQVQLNTTSLAGGFYILQIANDKTGESEFEKFVKQK